MSRTIRTNKLGEKLPDGKHRYKCRCSWCMGYTRKKMIVEKYDKQIKETVDDIYGIFDWRDEFDQYEKNYPHPTLDEEIAWINYQEAA